MPPDKIRKVNMSQKIKLTSSYYKKMLISISLMKIVWQKNYGQEPDNHTDNQSEIFLEK